MQNFGCEMMKKLFLAIFLASLLFAGGEAGAFLRAGMSAQNLALGNISTTTLTHAGLQNPGMLGFSLGYEFTTSYAYLPLDRRWNALSFAANLPPTAAVSLGWIHAGVHQIDGRDFQGEHTEYLSTSQDAFVLAFANKFSGEISIGIAAKLIQHRLLETTAIGFGLDFGFASKITENWLIAGSVRDIKSQTTWKTEELFEHGSQYEEKYPLRIAFGICWRNKYLELKSEWEKIQHVSERIRAGISYHLPYRTVLRAGFDGQVLRGGFGIEYDFLNESTMRFDYAVDPGRASEGISHWFTWSLLL